MLIPVSSSTESGRGVQLIKTIIIMKNKIEILIKEVGVNEVEAILNQMKSKVNVNIKQELKKDFIYLLTGCTISFYGDDVVYKKDDEWYFYYSKSYNCFYFKFNFWFDFEYKYLLNYQELKELLVDIVEEVLSYKRVILMREWIIQRK